MFTNLVLHSAVFILRESETKSTPQYKVARIRSVLKKVTVLESKIIFAYYYLLWECELII